MGIVLSRTRIVKVMPGQATAAPGRVELLPCTYMHSCHRSHRAISAASLETSVALSSRLIPRSQHSTSSSLSCASTLSPDGTKLLRKHQYAVRRRTPAVHARCSQCTRSRVQCVCISTRDTVSRLCVFTPLSCCAHHRHHATTFLII
jgi:hypothetical protein